MERYLKGFYMSVGMFTAIPLPANLWGGAFMNLTMPCLPLVGGLIGVLWWGSAELLVFCKIHTVLAAAGISLIPFLSSGFLHLDGYMDTSDAVLSRRPPEEKKRILKDPHTGAFAVIMVAVLFVLQFSAVYVITESAEYFVLFIVIAVISRCCAAMSVLCLKSMPESSYAAMFNQNTGMSHKLFVIAIALSTVVAAFFCIGSTALCVAAAVVSGYICAVFYTYREFDGISGDLAGFAIVISELCGLIALAVV